MGRKPKTTGPRVRDPGAFKSVLVRMNIEGWRALKALAGGKELTDHRRFTLTTNIDVYFCDPQSQWQRGSNENTNSLLRQYFPKGTDHPEPRGSPTRALSP
jgi:hypothetical protein